MSEKPNILLINPSSRERVYLNTNTKVGTPSHPLLSLATIAAPLVQKGYEVKVVDMDLPGMTLAKLQRAMRDYAPSYVGITGTTPLYSEMVNLSQLVKDSDNLITVVVGGVHASVLPEEFIRLDSVDIVAYGEGDFTLIEILSGVPLQEVKGIYYKSDGSVIQNEPRELVQDLDTLPYPAWALFDLKRYKASYLAVRKNPVGPLETSRGCVFGCNFCNKSIFGRAFRVKSVGRVVDEMEYMLKVGFKEIHIQDDGFSTNLERAKEICDEIVRRDLRFPWSLFNGVRVDRVDLELMQKLKAAGCYQVAFGFESGNQEVLNATNKGTTLDQARQAVEMAQAAGLWTFGFFMFGLPGDTEETMQETIDFAVKLDLDLAKFDITIPYPGTPLYEMWKAKGYIKTEEWSQYICHGYDVQIYEHPNVDWQSLQYYYRKAYRTYYLRPKFFFKRFKKDLRSGDLGRDMVSFLKTRW
jgi:anaerobic magnesium-protoporphyrin IX monomethyl ester cyclase